MNADDWYAETWAGRRDALADQYAQIARDLAASDDPYCQMLGDQIASVAESIRAMTMYENPDAMMALLREAVGNIA